MSTRALFRWFDDETYHNKWGQACPIDAIGVSAHLVVEFSGFQEGHEPSPSSDPHGNIPSHCHSHQNCQQSGYILHAAIGSGEALVMLHRVMRPVQSQCVHMAIEIAHEGGTFVRHRHCNLRPCYGPLKNSDLYYCSLLYYSASSYLFSRHQRQWMPFWLPLSSTDKPEFN